jgi:hypothetical protein
VGGFSGGWPSAPPGKSLARDPLAAGVTLDDSAEVDGAEGVAASSATSYLLVFEVISVEPELHPAIVQPAATSIAATAQVGLVRGVFIQNLTV